MKEKAIALYEHTTPDTRNILASTMNGQISEPLPITFADRDVHQALKYATDYLSITYGINKRNIWGVRLETMEFAVFDMTAVPQELRSRVTPDLLPYPHVRAAQIEIDSENKIGHDSSFGSKVH